MVSKYYNQKVVTDDGKKFDSKLEARRYRILQYMQDSGKISNLETQVKFQFVINDVNIGSYIADFAYLHNADNRIVVEDTKNEYLAKEPIFTYKKKLMKALYGIDVVVINTC